MSKGKRYSGEKQLNIKKIIGLIAVIIIIICAIIAVASGMAAKYVGRKDKEKNETKENIDETEVEKGPDENKTE